MSECPHIYVKQEGGDSVCVVCGVVTRYATTLPKPPMPCCGLCCASAGEPREANADSSEWVCDCACHVPALDRIGGGKDG